MDIINWIISNISLITLLITLFLAIGSIISAIASFKSSKLNSESLKLASQPTLKVEGNGISIIPDIKMDNDENPIMRMKDILLMLTYYFLI